MSVNGFICLLIFFLFKFYTKVTNSIRTPLKRVDNERAHHQSVIRKHISKIPLSASTSVFCIVCSFEDTTSFLDFDNDSHSCDLLYSPTMTTRVSRKRNFFLNYRWIIEFFLTTFRSGPIVDNVISLSDLTTAMFSSIVINPRARHKQ